MDKNIGACKIASKCKYGKGISSGQVYTCDYILMEKKPRTSQPNGQIVNGRCGLFTPRKGEE